MVIAKGTGRANANRQDSSVTRPPRTRPPTKPAAPAVANTPIARPRACGSVQVDVISENAAGARNPAATPSRARAPMSTPAFGASAATTLKSPKTATAVRSTRRLPRTSAHRPPRSRNPP